MIYATVVTLKGKSPCARSKDYRTLDNLKKFGIQPCIARMVGSQGEVLRGPYLITVYEDGRQLDTYTEG